MFKKMSVILAGTALMSSTAFGMGGGHHGGLDVKANNDSRDAIAVGNTIAAAGFITPGSAAGAAFAAGSSAVAGSITVTAPCNCNADLKLRNKSNGAIAVGDATAGSVTVALGHGFP